MATTVTTMGVLEKIRKRLSEPDPLLNRWGDILLTDIAIGFETEQDPSGRPWDPLSPATRKRVNPGNTILKDSNMLFDSIDKAIEESSVIAGPSRKLEYELIQHLGGSTGPPSPNTIPARPYVGVSDDAILEIRREYLDYWFNV